MKEITLLKSTMVEGTFRKAGWNGEVSSATKRTLLSMGKIEADETEESVEVSLAVDVTNTEDFENMKNDLEEHKGEITRLNNEIETLKNTITAREKEYATLYEDVFTLPLKELRAKYQNAKEREK